MSKQSFDLPDQAITRLDDLLYARRKGQIGKQQFPYANRAELYRAAALMLLADYDYLNTNVPTTLPLPLPPQYLPMSPEGTK